MASRHDELQQPAKTPFTQTRRTALKKMLVGSGVAVGASLMPTQWAKPVIEKVLVPAHAQTSDRNGCTPHPVIHIAPATVRCTETEDESLIDEQRRYIIDDLTNCNEPQILEVDSAEPMYSYITRVYYRRDDDGDEVSMHLEYEGYSQQAQRVNAEYRMVDRLDACLDTVPTLDPPSGNRPLIGTRVPAASSRIYIVTAGEVTHSGQEIQISDITFTPE